VGRDCGHNEDLHCQAMEKIHFDKQTRQTQLHPASTHPLREKLAAAETKHPNIGRTGTTCVDITRHLTVKNLYNCVILVVLSIFYDGSEDGRFNVGRNM
jgi:hypothetical protein